MNIYCFTDVVVKWPSNKHDTRIFAKLKLNVMLRNEVITSCRRQVLEAKDPLSIFSWVTQFTLSCQGFATL